MISPEDAQLSRFFIVDPDFYWSVKYVETSLKSKCVAQTYKKKVILLKFQTYCMIYKSIYVTRI